MRGKSDPQSILFVAAIELDQWNRAKHPHRPENRRTASSPARAMRLGIWVNPTSKSP
jgi:hypothetical protein